MGKQKSVYFRGNNYESLLNIAKKKNLKENHLYNIVFEDFIKYNGGTNASRKNRKVSK